MSKHIIITGASAGIGLHAAKNVRTTFSYPRLPTSKISTIAKDLTLHVIQRKDAPEELKAHAKENGSKLCAYKYDFNNTANVDEFFTKNVFGAVKEDKDAKSVFFLQNAGVMGDIQPVGNCSSDMLLKVMNVNAISPSILINAFAREFATFEGERRVSIISSGAAVMPFAWWSQYCSSKAMLEMNLRVLRNEQNAQDKPIWAVAISPGIVWSGMQDKIAAGDSKWPLLGFFQNYKKEGKGWTVEQSGTMIGELLIGDKFIELAKSEKGRIEFMN